MPNTAPIDQLRAVADFFQADHTYLRLVGERNLYFRVLSVSTDNPNNPNSLNGDGPVAFGWAHVAGPSAVWIPTGHTSFFGWRDVTDTLAMD